MTAAFYYTTPLFEDPYVRVVAMTDANTPSWCWVRLAAASNVRIVPANVFENSVSRNEFHWPRMRELESAQARLAWTAPRLETVRPPRPVRLVTRESRGPSWRRRAKARLS